MTHPGGPCTSFICAQLRVLGYSNTIKSPGHAGGGLADDGSQSGHHGPSAVDELAFPEPLQAKHLVIGRQGVLHAPASGQALLTAWLCSCGTCPVSSQPAARLEDPGANRKVTQSVPLIRPAAQPCFVAVSLAQSQVSRRGDLRIRRISDKVGTNANLVGAVHGCVQRVLRADACQCRQQLPARSGSTTAMHAAMPDAPVCTACRPWSAQLQNAKHVLSRVAGWSACRPHWRGGEWLYPLNTFWNTVVCVKHRQEGGSVPCWAPSCPSCQGRRR